MGLRRPAVGPGLPCQLTSSLDHHRDPRPLVVEVNRDRAIGSRPGLDLVLTYDERVHHQFTVWNLKKIDTAPSALVTDVPNHVLLDQQEIARSPQMVRVVGDPALGSAVADVGPDHAAAAHRDAVAVPRVKHGV